MCGLWLLLAACRPGSDVPPPLEVLYAGCRTVLAGPVCVPQADRPLRLWLRPQPDAELDVRLDGQPQPLAGTAVDGGLHLELRPLPAVRELHVRARGPSGTATWTLALGAQPASPWLAELQELRRRRDLGAAQELLDRQLAKPGPEGPGEALSLLALLRLDGGDSEAARPLLQQAIDAHRQAGRQLEETNDATVLAFLELSRHRFSAARAVLDELTLGPTSPGEAHFYAAYYRGLLADGVGDFRSALDQLSRAVEVARRLGLERGRRLAEQVLGRVLRRLGRDQEAAALFARLQAEAAAVSPCDRLLLLNNHAWSLLLALEAGDVAEDPVPLFERALALLDGDARDCPWSDDEQVNLLLNLALGQLHRGRAGEAQRALSAVGALGRPLSVPKRLWQLEIEARLALRGGAAAAALARYRDLARLAVETLSPEAEWRAAVGQARAHAALDDRPAALAALAAAEALLDRESLEVPLQEGRETFVAQREAGTRFYLELLLAADQPAEALAVARRSRSRVLAGLRRAGRLARLAPPERQVWDQAMTEYRTLREELDAAAAADWQLPAAQLARVREERAQLRQRLAAVLDRAFSALPPAGDERSEPWLVPRAGELVLAYHPLSTGWVAFAADDQGVTARRFDQLEPGRQAPAELAARLLAPFAERIARARRLRVLPYGALRVVDFHALPFAGGVLLEALPVSYGLDLAAPAVDLEAGGRALLVADPEQNLPAARGEATAVARALSEAGGWQVASLAGAAAEGEAVRRELPRVALFHYAGHASFAGWESALPLAGGSRLTVGDILALERAPPRVVLSGCETGRSRQESPAESIGLAQAFLAAGSRSVVAATRPVADRAAAELIAALYRDQAAGADPAVVLQQAQLAWRAHQPAADWASFRLLEP